MSSGSLLASAAVAFIASAVFLQVARAVASRITEGPGRLAGRAFAVWWGGLSVYSFLVGGLSSLFAALGFVRIDVFTTLRSVAVLDLVIALAGLAVYFAYLFTGRKSAIGPVVAFYIGVYVYIVFVFAGRAVAGVAVSDWTTLLVFSPAPDPRAMFALFVLLTVPQIVGAIAYFGLVFRLEDPGARFRAGLVAGAIVAWAASSLVGDLVADPFLQLVTRPVLGLAAAATVYLAYAPPAWIRARYGVDARMG